jgi:HNH endonuclease
MYNFICQHCGKKCSSQHKNHKYCSLNCCYKNRKRNLIKLICKICCKEYYVPNSRVKDGSICCSKKCLGEWVSINFSGKNSPNWKGSVGYRKCVHCRKKFLGRSTRKFCSRYCKNKWQEDNTKGSNNSNWRNGVTIEREIARKTKEYQRWRRKVIKRDNYKCRTCGRKSKGLNAHHIKPFATYVKLRYDVDNGITYCPRCHMKVEKREYYDRLKMR